MSTELLSALSSTDGVVLALGTAWILFLLSKTKQGLPHPPGPRPLPLVGNLFQIPQTNEWPIYEAWAKKYGPITYLTMFGTPMIVLNTIKAVRDLMEDRRDIYSDRPLMALKELCEIDWVITYANAGEGHRARRTIVKQYFSGPGSIKHRLHQQEECRNLVANLLNKPDNLKNHIKQHTASSILLGTYGYRVSGADDPIIHEMEETFKVDLDGPLAFFLESGPDLKNWPTFASVTGFSKVVENIKRIHTACKTLPFVRSKQMIDDGTAVPCFISSTLDEIASDPTLSPSNAKKQEELVKDCAAVMYGAALESTIGTLHTFFALMALHPHVMQQAQDEIDSITEGERLPTFDDWDKLPYISAIILEVLRHNTVTPLGLPHAVAQDDVYNGMLIPKGSMICVNLWIFFRDPEIFVDPSAFKPERFLGNGSARCREIMNLAWGFGKRTCPGRQFAEANLFITISTVIACFNIAPQLTATGEIPELSYQDGFVRRPNPFPVLITPRSPKLSELLD